MFVDRNITPTALTAILDIWSKMGWKCHLLDLCMIVALLPSFRGSTTFHTSTVRSGLRLLLNWAHLKPIRASWLACTKGQFSVNDGMQVFFLNAIFHCFSNPLRLLSCQKMQDNNAKVTMPWDTHTNLVYKSNGTVSKRSKVYKSNGVQCQAW
jgi:hypothetical protein